MATTKVWEVALFNSGDQDKVVYTVLASDIVSALSRAWQLDESAEKHAFRVSAEVNFQSDAELGEDVPADVLGQVLDRLDKLEKASGAAAVSGVRTP